jgi:hypothetical protein
MIDERVLTEWLHGEAERVDVPGDAPGAIVDLLADREIEHHRNRRQLAYVALIATAVIGIAFALGPARRSISDGAADVAVRGASSPSTQPPAASETTGAHTTSEQEKRERRSVDTLTPPDAASAGNVASSRAADTPKVVRTGAVALEVADDQLGRTVSRVAAIAEGAGGYVAQQETTEHGDAPTATITIRVPSEEFAATLDRVRGLGTVLGASTKGADVTGQYTDLQARRRSLDAARNALLGVLQQAKTTGEILAVLDRVTQVQTELETVDGEIQLLDDRTSFGSLTVSINEPAPAAPAPSIEPEQSGLARAFDDAKAGFSRRVEWLVAHSGSGVVIAASLLAALFVLRLSWVRLRRGWL